MSTRTKTIITAVAAVLVAVLCFGMIALFNKDTPIFQGGDRGVAETEYNLANLLKKS